MGDFILPNSEPGVRVHLTRDLSQDELLSFPAFKTWINTLQHSLSLQKQESHAFNSSPYSLKEIRVQAIDRFGGKRLGFVKLQAEVSNKANEQLPASVFLRGGSVCMLVRNSRKNSKD
jgi:ADP-sugar diphosphatase